MGGRASRAVSPLDRALASHAALRHRVMAEFNTFNAARRQRWTRFPELVCSMKDGEAALEEALQVNEAAAIALFSASASTPSAAFAAGTGWEQYDDIAQLWDAMLRDWASEGAAVRSASYGPILRELSEATRRQQQSAGSVQRCVVVGSGCGRLAYEVARTGIQTDAVEPAGLMHAAAECMLQGRPLQVASLRFYPHLDRSSNHAGWASRMTLATAPDAALDPAAVTCVTLHCTDLSSYAAVSTRGEAADAVVTSFLLDALPDPVQAAADCASLLRPGGVWVNLGPLDYHPGTDPRPTMQDLRVLLERDLCCSVERWEQLAGVRYVPTREGALREEDLFNPVLFVVRKTARGSPPLTSSRT
eukprot:TRINITY_DN28102_c0_g1_i1.p1 TRINITY_DN28102_c0_g1~~TRINITY_DN28102_c0_g1_i1.p1  ORF type:complete len:385 (+),score=62.38 TRINITY_DN28102_c0_g1_i1:75-1157(+)